MFQIVNIDTFGADIAISALIFPQWVTSAVRGSGLLCDTSRTVAAMAGFSVDVLPFYNYYVFLKMCLLCVKHVE